MEDTVTTIVFLSFFSAGLWKMFEKAGKVPFSALVPGWNLVVIIEMVGRPWNHIFFMLLPIYNTIFLFRLFAELSRSFGKRGIMFYLLAIFLSPIYFCYLGFSPDIVYENNGPKYE